jgi:predicted lipoprotein with Yx(FWY)xxD motif
MRDELEHRREAPRGRSALRRRLQRHDPSYDTVWGMHMPQLKPLFPISMIAVFAAIVAIFLADRGMASPAASAARSVEVQARSGALGRYLVDGRGRSLYLFEKDRRGRSTCYGGCASIWPPLMGAGHVSRGAGVSAAKLGTVARRGGGRQVTYAGHPLYFYAGDSHAGQTAGEGLNQFGAIWDIVSPSGRGIDR